MIKFLDLEKVNNRFRDEIDKRIKSNFKQVHQHLKNKGTEIVVIGCIDIRYYNENNIDSLEILKI